MKIEVKRADMLKSMQVCSKLNSGNSILPVLNQFLCDPKGEYLLFVSTDGKRRTTTFIKTESMSNPVKFTIPMVEAITIFSKMTDENVVLSIEDKKVDIIGLKSKFTLTSCDAAEFPGESEFIEKVSFKIDAEVFFKAVSRVLFSTMSDVTRPVLAGCLLAFNGKTVDMVTTDGKRMSLSTKDFALEGEPIKIVCPTDTLGSLAKILTGEVTVGISDKMIKFRTDAVCCFSNLVEGTYPDYTRFSNIKFDKTAKLKTLDLKKAIDIVSVAFDKSLPLVKFSFKTNKLAVSAVSGTSQAEDVIDCEYDGELDLLFSPAYLNQSLKVCDFEELYFSMTSDTSPVEISDRAGYRYILMPFK